MKKTRRFATLILLMAITTALVTGCKNITDFIGDGNNGDNSPKTYSVTVATGIENGTITANKITVPANETVVLTATPNDGYQLTSIRATVGNNAITVSGTGNTRTFTMPSGDVSVNATFTAIDYTINISDSISHGSVTADKTTAHYGDTITLTAEPDAGYQFYEWAATDSAGTALTITDGSFTMPLSSVTVTASFSPINSTISVTDGIATVNGNRAISADAGTTVTVTATPPTGKQFTNWTTTTSGLTFADATASSTTFTMPDCSVDITANCTDINYTISQASSFPHGSVTYNSTATYNSTVTLTISPSNGYRLGGISVTKASGGTIYLSGSGNTRTFTMPAENVTVFASFTAQSYNITKAQISNGTLSVNSSASCDSTVTVTANPASGYQFGSITVSNGSSSVPVSGSGNTRTFTMPANNVTVSATFNPINYNVTVGSISHGSVTANKTTAHYGDTITLNAEPDAGYQFYEWAVTDTAGTAVTVTNNSFTMPMKAVTVSATFTPINSTISITDGSASINGQRVINADAGTTVTITATPPTGKQFSNWTTTTSGLSFADTTSSSTTFTMPDCSVAITANCTDINYTISQASSFPHGRVTYNSTATYNSTVTLTISTDDGYTLSSITVKNATGETVRLSGEGNTRTFKMPASNVTVSATFNPLNYTATRAQISNGSITINGYNRDNVSAACGSLVTVSATPANGYQLYSITASTGSTIIPVNRNGDSGTFTMPAGNVSVSATFTPINYTVTNSGSFANGSVTASKTSNAHIGDTITLTVAPNTGYRLDSITASANGSPISLRGSGNTNGSTRQFTMPAGNVTISASFTLEDYRITKAGMSSGTVNFSNPTAHYNETVTLTIVPDNSFILDTISVTANGNPLTLNGSGTAKGSTRTFTMPASEVSISATFVRTHLGTKDKPTAVGDIVFNDGTATPYSAGMTLTEQQKQAAIAIIFSDNIPNGYVLGMGLKHDKRALCSNQSAAWGRRSDLLAESDGAFHNYQINCLDDYNEDNYPAFWCAEHYAGSGNLAGDNNWDWFLPVKNELQDVYRQKALIDAINDLLGSTYADPIRTDFGYWSGTQQSTAGDDLDHHAFILRFADGLWVSNGKDESDYNVLAVRRFHF